MFNYRFPLVVFIVSLLDYLFKAAVNYRLTDEGAAEWSDVEASLADILGDDEAAEAQRSEAIAQRATARDRQSTRSSRPVSQDVNTVRRPLSED